MTKYYKNSFLYQFTVFFRISNDEIIERYYPFTKSWAMLSYRDDYFGQITYIKKIYTEMSKLDLLLHGIEE